MSATVIHIVWIMVFIYPGVCYEVNVALNKPTSTTSGVWYSTGRGYWNTAGVVDGDTTTLNYPSSCFHANITPSDWTVDLGQEYQLYRIVVYMRTGYNHRIANSRIYVDNNPSRVCNTFPLQITVNPTSITCNHTARYITIRRDSDYLNVCEVEIYACARGYRGETCQVKCNCEDCDRWTGICTGNCFLGYGGNRCDTACSATNSYGLNCMNQCDARKCANTPSTCDPINGACDNGCLTGWNGLDCTEECKEPMYGSQCSYNCMNRHCLGNSSCDHVTGACDKGCTAGWKEVDCSQACSVTNSYGLNCMNQCDARKCANTSSTCDPVNGACENGCLTGWSRLDCTEACSVTNSYGLNCMNQCDARRCANTSSTCDPVNGACENGCLTGWIGLDCTEECQEPMYGSQCSYNCMDRHCLGNSSCDHETGACDKGCTAGWMGIDCLQELDPIASTNDETDIGLTAGAATAGVLAVLIVVLVLTVLLLRRRRNKSSKNSSRSDLLDHKKDEKGLTDIYETIGLENEEARSKADTPHVVAVANLKKSTRERKDDGEYGNEEEEEEEGINDASELPASDDKNYYNLGEVQTKHRIPVSQLEQVLEEMKRNPAKGFNEFESLPTNFLYSYDEAKKAKNKGKNRFKDYYPYDYNRVVLADCDEPHKGDYINASYIDGYKSEKRFIASQGPYKKELLEDFWRMLWQERIKVIIMVTSLVEGGKVKCIRYWPENTDESFGDFKVTRETTNKLADYTITNLVVQHGQNSERRHIKHYHFTSWPDHDVPDVSSLLTFMRRVNNTSGKQKHPIVVHCSAGIGRTGTYIAVDRLVNQGTTEGIVDVVSVVTDMRGQRRNMVQTKEQYLCIYKAVADAMSNSDTSLTTEFIRGLNLDLHQLGRLTVGNRTIQEHLRMMQTQREGKKVMEDWIFLSSYRHRHGYVVTLSQPKMDPLWTQVYNSGSRTVITSGSDERNLFSSGTSSSASDLTATTKQSSLLSDDVMMYKVDLVKKEGDTTPIQYYHVKGEIDQSRILALTDALLQWTQQEDCEITTILSTSVHECGLLVLLVNLVSRLQDDGKVDVISDMRRIQNSLPGLTFTLGDVRCCVDFTKRWLDSVEMYANV